MNVMWNPDSQPTNSKFDLFDQLGSDKSLSDAEYQRMFLLGREINEMTLKNVKFTLFNCLDTVFHNLHALETSFEASDFACVRFEGSYFHDVKFIGCTFRQVEFVNCVFGSCEFPKQDVSFKRCIFLPMETVVAKGSSESEVKIIPSTKESAPEPSRDQSRFSQLEREGKV